MIKEAEFESMDMRLRFLAVSELWHCFTLVAPGYWLEASSASYWEQGNEDTRVDRW